MAALSQQALKDRPIMQLLHVSLKQMGLSLKIAKSGVYPTVSMVGRYGRNGDDFSVTNNDYAHNATSSIAVQAEWKFFQGGKTRAETNRVRRKIRALKAGIEGYRNRVSEEMRNALLDCQVAGTNIDTAARALDQAKENWRITDLQYKQQVATSTDVLDARAFLTQADTNYFKALYGYLDAKAGLERAIGGRPGTRK